jgi:mono/diheme cytochrome c family protein
VSHAPAIAVAVLAVLAAGAATASPGQDYMLYCMGCHGPEARGVTGKIPPLAGALPLYMRSAAGRDYVLRVPGAANSVLNDAQLAAVLNWLATTYPAAQGEPPSPFTPEEVTRARHTPLANVLATRHAVVQELSAAGQAPAATY